jgi:hypothetical protein
VVSIVGRVLSSSDFSTVIQASDHQQVRVNSTAGGMALPLNSIVEFVGKVNPDNTVNEITRIGFAEKFDLDSYETLLKKIHTAELRTIFHE